MAYTPEQRAVIALAKSLSAGAGPRVRQSLLEAIGVESSFRNLNYGDRDSQGVLQQRPSQGWGAPGNATQDIRQYLSRAQQLVQRGFRGSAGQLAQAVQHSAYPGRYDARAGEAAKLLGQGVGAVSSALTTPAPPLSIQSAPTEGTRKQIALALIAASQASSRGERPDYSNLYKVVGALRQPTNVTGAVGGGDAGPIPVMAQRGVSSSATRAAIATAKQYLGTAYHWGGASPKTGFDCSGLLQWSWSQAGVRIPRTSQQQWRAGAPVGRGQLHAGDAVFFEGGPGGPGHVGMMIDRTHFVEAPHTGAAVRVSTLAGRNDFVGARRFHR